MERKFGVQYREEGLGYNRGMERDCGTIEEQRGNWGTVQEQGRLGNNGGTAKIRIQ